MQISKIRSLLFKYSGDDRYYNEGLNNTNILNEAKFITGIDSENLSLIEQELSKLIK